MGNKAGNIPPEIKFSKQFGTINLMPGNPLSRVAIMVTTKGLMQGMSVIHPEATLPMVLVIPTMEIRKAALSEEKPMLSAIYKKNVLCYFF